MVFRKLESSIFLGRITAFNLTQSLSYLVLLKAEGLYIRKSSQLGTLRTCFAGKSSFMCFVIGISLINSVFFQKCFDFVPNLCNELLLGNYCRHSPTKVSLIIMSPEPYITFPNPKCSWSSKKESYWTVETYHLRYGIGL